MSTSDGGLTTQLVASAEALRGDWMAMHRPHAQRGAGYLAGLAHPPRLCWDFRCPCGQAVVIWIEHWVAADAGRHYRVRAHAYAHS